MSQSPIVLKDRSDLMQLPGFSGMARDTDGQPCVWVNEYNCGSDGVWDENWSCQCDDECPECGEVYTPAESTWVGPEDRILRGIWVALPEVGHAGSEIRVHIEDDQVRLSDGWVIIGKDTPIAMRAGPWPAYDALMHKKLSGLHEDAIVYAADGGLPTRNWVSLTAAVVENGRPVKNTKKLLRVSKSELAEFCDKWHEENIPAKQVEDEPDCSSGPGL